MKLDSDPNTNSFVRVWGAPPRTAEGKRRDRHTWWVLVGGKGLGEVVSAAARPVAAAREGRAREERVREKGKVQETEGGDEPEALSGSGRAVNRLLERVWRVLDILTDIIFL